MRNGRAINPMQSCWLPSPPEASKWVKGPWNGPPPTNCPWLVWLHFRGPWSIWGPLEGSEPNLGHFFFCLRRMLFRFATKAHIYSTTSCRDYAFYDTRSSLQSRVRYKKIPSEMEVPPRWHCWESLHWSHCWQWLHFFTWFTLFTLLTWFTL